MALTRCSTTRTAMHSRPGRHVGREGNRTLRFLDLGLLKATSALGEVPNRITDDAWCGPRVVKLGSRSLCGA